MRAAAYFCVCVLLFVLSPFLLKIVNPLRRSPESIRERLLQLTPVGTHISEAQRIIGNEMERPVHRYAAGYYWTNSSGGRHGPKVVGESRLEMHLEKYMNCLIIPVYVEAFWGFDSDGRLIDIWVRKTSSWL